MIANLEMCRHVCSLAAFTNASTFATRACHASESRLDTGDRAGVPAAARHRYRWQGPARSLALYRGGCPVHALSAFCHDTGIVLAQEPIFAPTGTDRGKAELTVAPVLIARLDWHGRVLAASTDLTGYMH